MAKSGGAVLWVRGGGVVADCWPLFAMAPWGCRATPEDGGMGQTWTTPHRIRNILASEPPVSPPPLLGVGQQTALQQNDSAQERHE